MTERPPARFLKLKTIAGELLDGEMMLEDRSVPAPGTPINRTADGHRYRVLAYDESYQEGNRLVYIVIVERLDEEGPPQ